MRTRTLLLLSVGTALLILLAGGVFLFQLTNEASSVEPARVGEEVQVGDVRVTVVGASETGGILRVDVEIGGVDDDDGVESFRLVTGDRRLEPLATPGEGRCRSITTEEQRCGIDFGVSTAEGSSRVLVLRRGDEQRNWVVTAA
jgi:hypothetical protein